MGMDKKNNSMRRLPKKLTLVSCQLRAKLVSSCSFCFRSEKHLFQTFWTIPLNKKQTSVIDF